MAIWSKYDVIGIYGLIEMDKGIENDAHYNNYSTCYKMIKKLESTITELGFTICFDDNFERVIRSL